MMFRNSGTVLIRLGLVLAVAIAAYGCSRPVDLRFRPLPTEVRVIRVTTNQKVSVSVMEQNKDFNTSNTAAYTFKVDAVDPEGKVDVTVTLDEIDLGGSGGLAEMMPAMTGAGNAGAMNAEALGLKGKSFKMKVTPDGQVEQVSGMSGVVEEVSKKLVEETKKQLASAQLPPEAQAMQGMMSQIQNMVTEMIETQIRRSIGDAAMQEAMGDLLTMYAGKSIKVGETWNRGVIRAQGMYPLISSETWKLVENKDGVAKLECQSQITPNNSAATMSFGGTSVQMLISGQSNGAVDVDAASGWLTKGTSTHQLDIHMKMTLPVPIPGLDAMTTKVSGTVTIECMPKYQRT